MSRLRSTAVALSGCLLATLAPAAAASASEVGFDPVNDKGSLVNIRRAITADQSSAAGFTGKGVGIALIDTGVTEVRGLDTGNVWHGPDLSFDSQDPELRNKDGYGHGTHLASIMVGRDAVASPTSYNDPNRFAGVAPDATLVSVKVGAQDGAVDVTQVIAAINWVVENKNAGPVPIRVINLSYGTDSTQDTRIDPLAYAVENAWRNGIVVVVAGGNDGSDLYTLANPARDPYVLAVGASDTRGTTATADDDFVPAWASRGTNDRHVDVVAPGVSVLGLRVPGGYADTLHPESRVGRFARASGTSQAAAVVSGQVALMLQEDPSLRPDVVKRQIMSTATPFFGTPNQYRGNGLVNVRRAQTKDVVNATQSTRFYGTGTGSIEASRGSSHVSDGLGTLTGEIDIFGNAWNPKTFSSAVANQSIWQGRTWRGTAWTGDGWEGRTWRSADWSASAQTAGTWAGRTWRDEYWSGRTWRESSWEGRTWRDGTWSGRTWRSTDLASNGWS